MIHHPRSALALAAVAFLATAAAILGADAAHRPVLAAAAPRW